MEELAPFVRDRGCHYVILREEKEILGEPSEYGWEMFGGTDGYVIYRNTEMPLTF